MNPSHPFLQQILNIIKVKDLIGAGDHVLAGVSGGPDSMALLECLAQLREPLRLGGLTVLHFDHGLRGEEAAREKELVRRAASERSLHLVVGEGKVRDVALREGISLEMAARKCRHQFFREAMQTWRGDKIALGHHAGDQAEELLLRLCRGTGPSGMAGMAPKSGQGIVRPLLFVSRKEILQFLNDLGIRWAKDSSNEELCCQRNALRLEVMPLLEHHFHRRVIETLGRHATLALEEEDYWETLLRDWCGQFTEKPRWNALSVRLRDLQSQHRAFRKRFYRCAVRELTGACSGIFMVHVEALDRFVMGSQSGRHMRLPGGVTLFREGNRLIFSREEGPPFLPLRVGRLPEVVLHGPGIYKAENFRLVLRVQRLGMKEVPDFRHLSANTACVDADRVRWPLFIRGWQKGDRFQPLGLGGCKKLQDFFVDAKVPRGRRVHIPIVCDVEKICWVVGHRLDDRVKVTSRTREILFFEVLTG